MVACCLYQKLFSFCQALVWPGIIVPLAPPYWAPASVLCRKAEYMGRSLLSRETLRAWLLIVTSAVARLRRKTTRARPIRADP